MCVLESNPQGHRRKPKLGELIGCRGGAPSLAARGRLVLIMRFLLLAGLACARGLAPLSSRAPGAGSGLKLLLDPLELDCCAAQLQQHPELAAPRLLLQARPAKIEVAELEQMCQLLRSTLDRKEPFTVTWDLRQMRPPSRAALRFGVDWMGEGVNKDPIDDLVRSTVIIASSPVVRAVCGWILKVCRPPRPVRLCEDDDAALAVARELESIPVASARGSAVRERAGRLSMCVDSEVSLEPDESFDVELDDISNLLEAMDIAADPEMEAATALQASQLPTELDVDSLKQSLAKLKEDEELAAQTKWQAAFGSAAEAIDTTDGEADDDADGFGEPVTF